MKATKLTRPGVLEPSASAMGGFYLNSQQLQPPPSAPNPATGLWVNSRLPPISSLEALNENSPLEFGAKKTVSAKKN